MVANNCPASAGQLFSSSQRSLWVRAPERAREHRLPKTLLSAVKDSASHEGIPYQRFIRLALNGR